MIVRYCPFCASSDVTLMQHAKTPEEDRDTEVYLCFDCKYVIYRERTELEDKLYDLFKNETKEKLKQMVEEQGVVYC